jgi:hypothetical protein
LQNFDVKNEFTVFFVPKNGLLITNLTKTLKGIIKMNELFLNKSPIQAAQKSKGAASLTSLN